MDYSQAREYIKCLHSRGIVPGLESIRALMSALGDPQDELNIIHIAGTNGKGSTGVFIESILMAAGKSVFRFSSPSVGDYLEMYTHNGKSISEYDYAQCVDKISNAATERGIIFTEFEAETAAAFLLAKKYSPDHVIIECGMGGRLDSTNIIKKPELSVITSISKDHTAFLGNTLYDIALEKSGIIKSGIPAVSAQQTTEAVKAIKEACAITGSELHIADTPQNIEYSALQTFFDIGKRRYAIKLPGAYQPQNAALAVRAAMTLGIDEAAIEQGLANAYLPYRFERIGRYILDGAHNSGAAEKLADSVRIYLNNRKTAFICGMFRDKDQKKIAELTAALAEKIFTVSPPPPRGLDSAALREIFRSQGADAVSCASLEEAIGNADSGGFDSILIFGSLSILGEAKKIITAQYNERDKH